MGLAGDEPGDAGDAPGFAGRRSPRRRRPTFLRLIEAADAGDRDLAAFLRTSVTTGARRGELCALRSARPRPAWPDRDIAHNLVEGSGGELVEKDTKTPAAPPDRPGRHHG